MPSLSLVAKSRLPGQGAGHSIFIGKDDQAYSVRKMNFKCEIFINTNNKASWIGFLLISVIW